MPIRNTTATREVLRVFVTWLDNPVYGLDIVRETGLASGSVYPILHRLETEGWLASRWENIDPTVEGRPARRLYSLTAQGATGAAALERVVEERKRRARLGWQRELRVGPRELWRAPRRPANQSDAGT